MGIAESKIIPILPVQIVKNEYPPGTYKPAYKRRDP